jgi:hypothetical protein
MICGLRLWSMSLIHRLLPSALATVLFFCLLWLYSSGKRAARLSPLSHREFQKDVFLPFPRWTIVTALNKALSSFEMGSCRPSHVRCVLSQLNHSQRSLSDWLKWSRSFMPNPPLGCGVHTFGQATLHFPPASSPSPAHRNFRLILSSSLRNFVGALITVSK